MHKLLLSLSTLLISSLLISPVAFAHLGVVHDTPEEEREHFRLEKEQKLQERQEAAEERQQKMEARKDEILENRCEIIGKRVDNRVREFENKKNAKIKRYETLKERISSTVLRLETQGYDVSTLKTDLITLDEMVVSMATHYANFINKLKESKSYPCGESEGQYKSVLEEAKVLMQTVHEDIREINDYIKNVIKEDLKALREQKVDTEEADL